MKYYLYISDAKVDMLIAQIRHDATKKISTEFGFDLKVLNAKRRSESESDENRFTRLEVVISFIREYGNLGSVDKPGEYFEGTMPIRLGPLSEGTDPGIIYFTGRTKRTLVGLGGSPKHMIGSTDAPRTILAGSDAWHLYRYLVRHVENDRRQTLPHQDIDDMREMLELAEHISSRLKGPLQKLEFVAKRLQFGKIPRVTSSDWSMSVPNIEGITQVLLGTPLYVALAQ